MRLRIKASPNAQTNQVNGWETDPLIGKVLKIRIQAPPVDGKANKAILDYIAKELGLSKSQVKLEKGQTSRIKTFTIPDGTVLPE